MAASLTNAALAEVRPAHASYYGKIDEKNPVIQAVGKELDEFCRYIVKSKPDTYKREPNEAMSRGSNWLFDIWNKYALRLPTKFYHEKLMQIGDFLLNQEVYEIALHQCYSRFLTVCHGIALKTNALTAVECKNKYFSGGFNAASTLPTCQALLGAFSCQFHMIRVTDPDFGRSDSVTRCVVILKSLEGFMQCIQRHEPLYWVMYNCTIRLYEMCRKLMVSGHSIKVVEYLVWACMCTEMSIPLLAVQFLTWRVTLYTAVCLAYYDCKAGALAEKFARRSLTKLQELSELESMSGAAENETTRLIFQQATVKMAAMVFKRTVFESRRRPKGVLRPKMRNNLKEAASLMWPRTQTEKLLSDMFVGGAAQFLAIIEALTDSHRRCLRPRQAAAENDVEMLDVYAELFFAGKEIIAGGGGGSSNQTIAGSDHSIMGGMRNDKSLIQLAAAGEDGVTLVSVVRFIKLAFCYEQWDTFTTLLDSALLYIKKYDEAGETEFKDLELCLAVMLLSGRVTRAKTVRKVLPSTSVSAANVTDDKGETQTATESSQLTILPNDDLINLAEAIYFCASNASLFTPMGKDQEILLDRDMVLDVCILLWKKAKSVLLRLRSNGQIENTSPKWMHLLQILNSCFVWCGIASVEPTILADVALHLASLLELSTTYGEISAQGLQKSRYSVASDVSHSQYHTKTDRLSCACEVLSNAINSLCAGITQTMSFTVNIQQDWDADTPTHENTSNLSPRDAMIQDFLVELLNAHHRIYFKLAKRSIKNVPSKGRNPNSERSSVMASQLHIQVPEYGKKKMLAHVRGNMVSNALLHTQRASIEYSDDFVKAEESLTKAMDLLKRAENEENKLQSLSKNTRYGNGQSSSVPPPPILLARSNTAMVFKPAPFQSDTPVAWYRLFGRTSAGPNVKVRLNDYFLQGTGNEVPAGEECTFRVEGITPNERYVFAVAAYTSNGTLVGNGIGATSEVMPAHYPMSILNAWCILAESALRVGSYRIAKQAAQVLWNHFVEPLVDPNFGQFSVSGHDFELSLYKLNKEVMNKSSEVLTRHAITSVFISVEVAIIENGLSSTNLTDEGPLRSSQIARLKECEKMLVAMELCSHLGDMNLLLQAATKCFGLLIPIMQVDVYMEPVVQVLVRCHIVLQEACAGSLTHLPLSMSKSIHHMIASITFYLAKVFRAWGRPEACINIIETGKQLLVQNEAPGESSTSNVNLAQARKRGYKVVPKNTYNTSQELAALEERLSELTKEKNSAGELTGGEDASTVLSYIVMAKPMLAYKELAKFRRRSRYLEYFVHIMHKALINGMVEPAIEWSQEVLTWLRRRNDGLSVNYTILSADNGAIVMQGNDVSKYAAVIVNYSKNGKPKQRKKKMLTKKSKIIMKGKGDDQEDLERKALTVLEKYFLDMYKACVKRRKLRKLSNDEMPWRSRFNHLAGLLYFDILQQKLEKRLKQFKGDLIPSKSINLLDQNQWSLNQCGNIVVQPSFVTPVPVSPSSVPEMREYGISQGQPLLTCAKKAINAPFDADVPDPGMRVSPDYDVRAPSPQTQRTNSPASFTSGQTVDPTITSIQNNAIIDTFKIMMLSFRRALVLAHRGKSWTLLQNVSRSFLSCINYTFENTVNSQVPVMTRDVYRDLVCLPLTLAADFLLEMLVVMQCQEFNDGPSLSSYAGNIHDEKGGRNLHYDETIDDIHEYDFALIKEITFRCIEMLHFQHRSEQLVDICLRFSSLTHDRFAESILPIMIHAQHEIRKRVEENNGGSVPQTAWDSSGKTVTLSNENYIMSRLQTQPIQEDNEFQINIGGYIDPASHDVYGGGKRALALSCVPYDVERSLDTLHTTLEKSLYFSRALTHSRRLLGLYLASQYNKRTSDSSGGLTRQSRASSVSFVDVESKNQLSVPSNMNQTNFETRDDVETSPFTHLPTVISSYTKTIELLISHVETDLVSQAYHELGNLYHHSGNTKSALKVWNEGLDQIFCIRGAVSNWKNEFNSSKDVPELMLQRLGFWGCLLSIVLTCKIGEFSSIDIQKKTNCAILAAELVQALFRSSLPHPTSCSDYMSYEIFPLQVLQNNRKPNKSMPGATSIFPDVDMFSDKYRCEPRQFMSALHWLCENLVQLQFNLKAFPCLCLYQYIATFVCKDIQRSVQCRCIKLSALSDIRAFDAAINDMLFLLYGSRLPHPTEHTYREPDSAVPAFHFSLTHSIESLENLKAMEVIVSKRISPELSQLYGPQLTCEITLQRSLILVELANCISCIPQRPSQKDLSLISPDQTTERLSPLPGYASGRRYTQYLADDTRSSISAMSTTSTSMKHVKKLFSKRDTPMTIALLKGILLCIAEAFLNAMLDPILRSNIKLLPSEVWLAVHCRLQLCSIEKQRQHTTFGASHAFNALQMMQNSGKFEFEVVQTKQGQRSGYKSKPGGTRSLFNEQVSYMGKAVDNLEQKYRARLNARLWLSTRLKLCEALQCQITGLGKVWTAMAERNGKESINFLQLYCAEGLAEAEVCNDREMQAYFLLSSSLSDSLTSEEAAKIMEDAILTLDELTDLSDAGTVSLAYGTVTAADLQLQGNKWTSSHAVQEFHNAHAIILLHLMQHGETIRHFENSASTVSVPLKNIYHRDLQILAHIKLRIGHANYFTLTENSPVEEWQSAAEILRDAKLLCDNCFVKDARLQAEINFELGKVTRAVYFSNGCDASSAKRTLQEAIKASPFTFPILSRNSQLELAMLGITLSNDTLKASQSSNSMTDISQIAVALHSAHCIAKGDQSRSMLQGSTEIVTGNFSDKCKKKLPEFVLLDLATDHRKTIPEVTVDDITIDPHVAGVLMESGEFTWIHVLYYRILLLRKFASLRIGETNRPQTSDSDDSDIMDFYPGDIKQTDQRSQAVKTPMFSTYLTTRLLVLHDYLKEHLTSYQATCKFSIFDSKSEMLLVQWYKLRQRKTLLWCATGTEKCGKILVSPSDIARLLSQIKTLLQKVEIHFGQTMAVQSKQRSRNVRMRKQTGTSTVPPQLEDDVKQTLTNCALLFSPDHDVITTLPFVISVNAIENLVELFTIGCCYTSKDPLYNWLLELLVNED